MVSGSKLGRIVVVFAISIFATLAVSSVAKAQDITVTTLAGDQSAGSLGAAMEAINDTQDAENVITFSPSVTGTINLTQDLPGIGAPVEIRGPGMDALTIDGGDTHTIFFVSRVTTISGLTLANGGYAFGGAVNAGFRPLTLDSVRITGSTSWQGGAIAQGGGELTIKDSIITNNTAEAGGGIYVEDGGQLTITNTEITDNTATMEDGGGGIWMEREDADNAVGSLDLTGSKISRNTAKQGGGIWVAGVGSVSITDTKISDNDSTSDPLGGLGGSEFASNAGGGAAIGALDIDITGSEISGNRSTTGYGGISVAGNSTITSSLVAGNSAYQGAGLSIAPYSLGDPGTADRSTINNSTIADNTAGVAAAGLLVTYMDVELQSTTISGNTVTTPTNSSLGAGGMVLFAGDSELVNTIISGNSTPDLSMIQSIPGNPNPVPPATARGSFNLTGTIDGGTLVDMVAGSNLVSSDPKLGPLADNGGPTRSMLPADDSPLVDKGLGTSPADQRGLDRTVDFSWLPNAPGGNGTDIGSVEIQSMSEPPDPPDPDPSNKFSFGWSRLNKKTGVASLQIKVPGAGKVAVVGSKTVAKSSTAAKKESIVVVKVKAKGRAAKTLKKKGKVKVKATVKFTPTGGKASTKSKTLKLAKAKKKKRR